MRARTVAALVAIRPGHNIPMLATTPAIATEVGLLAASLMTGSVTFAATAWWLARPAVAGNRRL